MTRVYVAANTKSLPYLLCQMNLLLHGLDAPQIDPSNSLRFKLSEIGEKDRVDVILTNPPFGGEEEKGIQGNFPEDKQTAETALLFLQLIMRKLHRQPTAAKRAARAAVVVPNGVFSAPGVAKRIRSELLSQFNLHTIVRLPHNVFAPYTDVKTNVLFLEHPGPTTQILYCEPQLPGNLTLSKSKPLDYGYLDALRGVIVQRRGTDCSWLVQKDELGEDLNLDIKNPRMVLRTLGDGESLDHLSEKLQQLSEVAHQAQARLDEVTPHIRNAPLRLLGQLTIESDERIGASYRRDTPLVGVSADEGLRSPKVTIGKSPERYKVLRLGFLAYNPMRINIGSIGVVRTRAEEGITSPDYVVFYCRDEVLSEYVYHYLKSEPGRHAINQKTKGSVRFRLYFEQLATIPIPCPEDKNVQARFVEVCNQIERLRKQVESCANETQLYLDAATRDAFLVPSKIDTSDSTSGGVRFVAQ